MDQSLEPLNLISLILTSLVSILILVDQSLERIPGVFSCEAISRFNPYFSGSVTGTCLRKRKTAIYRIVSILILVDQSLEQKMWGFPFAIKIVSILILVDQSLEQSFICYLLKYIFVSILILVDQSLEQLQKKSNVLQLQYVSILILVDQSLELRQHI